MKKLTLLILVAMLMPLALAVGCAAPAPSKEPASAPAGISKEDAEAMMDKKLNEVDRKLALWSLQPGTGPRMDDLARHFNIMWYAAQSNNWTLAQFEVDDQVSGTVKRIQMVNPNLASPLDNWTKNSIEPLAAAAKAQDQSKFSESYDNAIAQCNACHSGMQAGGVSLKGIKVIRPTAPVFGNLDYKGN
ncbi:MAG: hypothetical protein M1380_07215 [Chloroflexi bacterium]|nr:hypothetical protein [Chloroflexota bacterium]